MAITSEEGVELKRLQAAYVTASKKAIAILQTKGMTSQSFLEAEQERTVIACQIKRILGTGRHWMAH